MPEKRSIMPLMTKEIVLSVADLRYLVSKCAKCQTQIAFDLKTDLPSATNSRRGAVAGRGPLPEECPVCEVRFNSTVQAIVDSLVKNLKALADSPDATSSIEIKFRMESDFAAPL